MEFRIRQKSLYTNEVSNQLSNFHIDDSSLAPSTFTLFPRLPTELRLKIWNLQIKSRIIHFNELAATRAKLQLDPSIPPVLHTCHESREEGLKFYQSIPIQKRQVYTHQTTDTLLWIRFSGPLTFRSDASLLDSFPTIPPVQNLAISVKFWNRITSLPQYAELYRKFRTSGTLKFLTIVDDEYGKLEWERVVGCKVRLCRTKKNGVWEHDERGVWRKRGAEELWEKWDGWREFPEGEAPEIKFARVGFYRDG